MQQLDQRPKYNFDALLKSKEDSDSADSQDSQETKQKKQGIINNVRNEWFFYNDQPIDEVTGVKSRGASIAHTKVTVTIILFHSSNSLQP